MIFSRAQKWLGASQIAILPRRLGYRMFLPLPSVEKEKSFLLVLHFLVRRISPVWILDSLQIDPSTASRFAKGDSLSCLRILDKSLRWHRPTYSGTGSIHVMSPWWKMRQCRRVQSKLVERETLHCLLQGVRGDTLKLRVTTVRAEKVSFPVWLRTVHVVFLCEWTGNGDPVEYREQRSKS